MDIVKDLVYVNKTAGKNSINAFKKSWFILFTGIVYTLLNIIIFTLIRSLFTGVLSILLGFVVIIVNSSFISNYLYLLYNIVNYNRITIQDFKDGFTHYLGKIYGVFFIAYVANLLLSLLSASLGSMIGGLGGLIYLGIFIVFNPLPETIYLKSYSSMESISNTLEFIKENWLNWLLPNLVFLILLYIVTGNIITKVFTTHLSYNLSIISPKGIVIYIIGQSLFSIMMIYRGHLYKILSSGTRRKRMFMNKF